MTRRALITGITGQDGAFFELDRGEFESGHVETGVTRTNEWGRRNVARNLPVTSAA